MPQPLIHLESLTKIFYTDDLETHAGEGVGLEVVGVEDLGEAFEMDQRLRHGSSKSEIRKQKAEREGGETVVFGSWFISAFCLLLSAFCLLPYAFCFLPSFEPDSLMLAPRGHVGEDHPIALFQAVADLDVVD